MTIVANTSYLKSLPSKSFQFEVSRSLKTPLVKVKSVRFDCGRYGRSTQVLSFSRPKTWQEALDAVERYLSQKISIPYFEALKSSQDLFPGRTFNELEVLGDCLGDCKFIEGLKLSSSGMLEISCAS